MRRSTPQRWSVVSEYVPVPPSMSALTYVLPASFVTRTLPAATPGVACATARTPATEGPVQAEVFVLRLSAGLPELAGPCGPEPWYLEVGADEDPVEVVSRLSRNLLGPPLLVHSTSWRRARGSVILSFIVVIGDAQ